MQFYIINIEKVELLSQMPVELLSNFLGKNGIDLWRTANGIDETPVVPFHEQKSMSTEHTFDQDTIDTKFLHAEIVRMTERLAFELRQQNRLTGCMTVKLRYSDFQTVTKQISLSYTNSDHVLMKTADDLFKKLYERRILVRLIGIRFTNLIRGNYQINLFEDTQEMINLYKAIDSVKNKYGEKLVMRAVGI